MHKAALLRAGLLSCSLLLPAACTTQDINTALDMVQQSGVQQPASLSTGIKQALELGAERASADLSQQGGYSGNPALRINLPPEVTDIANTLRRFGLGGQVDQIEALMNQGAEQAAGEAQKVFIDAIRDMSIEDALGIVRGSENAATTYFRDKTETSLRARYQPIIAQNLEKVGFYNQYRSFLSVYDTLPIPNKVNLDLEDYVLEHSLDGLFARMAQEEALIRQDPMGRGSAVIASVFNRK